MSYIDDRNYYNDSRVQAELRGKPEFIVVDDDGLEHELPTHWVVCPTCKGAGTHVNPSIDAGGLTRDDFDADPDFAEGYLNGAYDVPCYECGGRTTVKAVDTQACSPLLLQLWNEQERARYESAREQAAELAYGC